MIKIKIKDKIKIGLVVWITNLRLKTKESLEWQLWVSILKLKNQSICSLFEPRLRGREGDPISFTSHLKNIGL